MFNPGQEIVCVEVGNNKYITIGETYKVLRCTEYWVVIRNDDFRDFDYPISFFRVKKKKIERNLPQWF